MLSHAYLSLLVLATSTFGFPNTRHSDEGSPFKGTDLIPEMLTYFDIPGITNAFREHPFESWLGVGVAKTKPVHNVYNCIAGNMYVQNSVEKLVEAGYPADEYLKNITEFLWPVSSQRLSEINLDIESLSLGNLPMTAVGSFFLNLPFEGILPPRPTLMDDFSSAIDVNGFLFWYLDKLNSSDPDFVYVYDWFKNDFHFIVDHILRCKEIKLILELLELLNFPMETLQSFYHTLAVLFDWDL